MPTAPPGAKENEMVQEADQGMKWYGTLKGRTGWWVVRGDDWVPCAAPEKVNGRVVR